MATVQMHLHVSEQAAKLLEKYATSRTRGAFISELIVNHDRGQMDGEGVIELLRKKAREAQQEASRATNALKKYEELYGSKAAPEQPHSNGNGKKRR